ncbi:MAG: hypothetical protein ACSLEN_11045 [Candidatus Malihini olakiniferum]
MDEKPAPVRARAGLKIDPDYALDDYPALNCLIVSCGVVTAEMKKPTVIGLACSPNPSNNHYGVCLH